MGTKKQAEKYKKQIIDHYKDIVPLELKFVSVTDNLFVFRIEFILGTAEDKIRKNLSDVGQALKFPLFQLHREDSELFLVASKCKDFDNRLLGILTSPVYEEHTKDMAIPYPIGFDVMRRPILVDLVVYKHFLIGGASNSGKTIGLRSLITSTLWRCSPENVNLVVIDGPAELVDFNMLPHLSCPIIQTTDIGYNAVMAVHKEMKRRLILKNEDAVEFNLLPAIVLIIDECVSFVAGINSKQMSQSLAGTISLILRMGRHAKVYAILATQNPSVEEMKCDLSPITTRVAFACGKPHSSVTILGEGGAEQLSGNGEMFFASKKHTGLQYIKGAYISSEEIDAVCVHVRAKYDTTSPDGIKWDDSRKFIIDTDSFECADASVAFDADYGLLASPAITKQDIDDKLFVQIIMWSLERETVSTNQIKDAFGIGWPQARGFLEKLFNCGIVGNQISKLPRKVLPILLGDLSSEVINLLNRHGYTEADINKTLDAKNSVNISSDAVNVTDASLKASPSENECSAVQIMLIEKITESMPTINNNGEIASHQLWADGVDGAIKDITASIYNVASVIKAIDDIAFQTNLLAHNIADETARAGEHGKSFSMIADEVRNLAVQSQQVAKNATNMIESLIAKSESYFQLAE
jgi:S-DNA-T family DNA segregation ATPase FtsK/SpoIIIE